eukprot:COSAG01_NODE_20312_length_960_cov_0.907085_1_plen_162_part_00
MVPTITGTGNISVTNNVVSLVSNPNISGTLFASTIGATNSLVTNIHAATIYANNLYPLVIGNINTLVSSIYTSAIYYLSTFNLYSGTTSVIRGSSGSVHFDNGQVYMSLPTSTSGFTSANNGQLYNSNGYVKVYTHTTSGGGSGGSGSGGSGGSGGGGPGG